MKAMIGGAALRGGLQSRGEHAGPAGFGARQQRVDDGLVGRRDMLKREATHNIDDWLKRAASGECARNPGTPLEMEF